MLRAKAEERQARDAIVMRLFLAGVPYREIAKHSRVQLSARGVVNVIKKQLREATPRALAEQARAVYLMRLEEMLKAAWPSALAGDVRAIDACLRLATSEARLNGILDQGDGGEFWTGPPERDEHGRTRLDRYRTRHDNG